MESNWIIDLEASTATHVNYGLVVFYADNGDGSWDGEMVEQGTIPKEDFDASVLARMMREAGDEFLRALGKNDN